MICLRESRIGPEAFPIYLCEIKWHVTSVPKAVFFSRNFKFNEQAGSMANHLFDNLFGIHDGKETPFLHLPSGGIINHAEFLAMSARYARAMVKKGLKPGDRVAAQVRKSPQKLALYAACVQSGMVFLPLNTAYTIDELKYFIANSGASLIVCDSASDIMSTGIPGNANADIETLDADGGGTLSELTEGMPADFQAIDRAPDDLAALLYTSGTTGRSKGAMLTHDNLLSNALALAGEWRFTADDVLLHALPIFHTHGLFVATNIVLATGGSMIFMPGFDLDQIIDRIPQATSMMGVPTFYTRLLGDSRFTAELTSHMRLFVSGSAPLLADTHIRFEKRTGHRILERYGMTETNMNTSNPHDGERRPGTVGFPLPGVELKITDPDTGEELPRGEAGQIEVRGPNVFKGYWGMPEKTAAELQASGYFITGDIGLFDADGYLHIIGRGKDLIISGGYNIYPKEIELLLDSQEGVLESAVIGVPHPDYGETVLGIVVPEEHIRPEICKISEELKKTLASFKHPRRLIIVDRLPRNAMGKVQKNMLRDQYRGLFDST